MSTGTGLLARRLMWVIWPAFLVAAVAELVFFSVFDPFDLHFFGAPLDMSRQAIYTMGFFGFWGLGIASSALTVFLEGGPRATLGLGRRFRRRQRLALPDQLLQDRHVDDLDRTARHHHEALPPGISRTGG